MKKDYILSAVAGFFTGLFAIPVLGNLGVDVSNQEVFLLVGLPLLFVLGTGIALFLKRFGEWIFQFAKYVATGFLNAAIDFGILNLLIVFSGVATGAGFSLFKALSFIIANTNSFFWNKYWVFSSGRQKIASEYATFLAVSIVGILVNVGIASIVVNFIPVQFGLSPQAWANIGAVFGSAGGILWNFAGYKFIVFSPNGGLTSKTSKMEDFE